MFLILLTVLGLLVLVVLIAVSVLNGKDDGERPRAPRGRFTTPGDDGTAVTMLLLDAVTHHPGAQDSSHHGHDAGGHADVGGHGGDAGGGGGHH